VLWFDTYDRQARAAPGLLVLLPIAIVGTVVGLRSDPVVSGAVGAVIAAGGPLILAGVVRQQGLATQAKLFAKWRVQPTTSFLLLSSTTENTRLREERRTQVQRATNVGLLDEAQERENPRDAENRIETAVTALREKTRDNSKFPLVAAENRNYGFERNILGVRPLGIVTSSTALVTLTVLVVLSLHGAVKGGLPELLIGLGCALALLLTWTTYPSETRVRRTAEKYAASLLDSASTL
jgi:hypothetical protein